ncbi:E3 ubiquitin-protein ligase Siah2 isoform X2 [Eurytemora carolleeae]|uniref:E3 ubiquitin-protein ligase Siah2 isoform X2 n=1 Tax=Eurytemora carolleeae TaxID=1294199 RepID=UPI000C7684AE|nr:E3 ubiquitin-protein ligase Siah2 isoform X2 [Eurytemora carolleeae]|eukprot:XP_023336810.1 E3 ubiquitin-protein ligase Siah2-like isoform X2 [Eurytemora affinis]
MVRTRSIVRGGRSGFQSGHGWHQESSLRSPSKGRKRQLTNVEDSPSVLTSSAALSPLPGLSSGHSFSRYQSQDESSIPLGRRSSNSSREQEQDPDQDQDQPMEPNQNWVEQDGYLTPGHALHLAQVNLNQQTVSQSTLSVSEPPLMTCHSASPLSTIPSLPLSTIPSSLSLTASNTSSYSLPPYLPSTNPRSSQHPSLQNSPLFPAEGQHSQEAEHLQPGGNGFTGNIAHQTSGENTSHQHSVTQNATLDSDIVHGVVHHPAQGVTHGVGHHPGQGPVHGVAGGGGLQQGGIHHQGGTTGEAEDLVGNPREERAADLVIFTTRESGVQADVDPPSSQSERDTAGGFLPDDIKHSLECPVCARIALPPVMQCRNGHVTCNACRVKVQSCPMCREIDIDIRNLFAEKAITYMSIPCEYRSFGCRIEINFKDKEMHERQCRFRPYICPYIECDHKLAADAVVLHVSTAHREECRRSDGPEITASMILIGMYFGGDGAWSPRVITCFGRTFFDVALTRDRWLHHWVWLLGEEEESSNYLYEITAFKGNTKYVYGSEVSSLRTSDDDIVSEGKCLSISDAIGRRLRDGDKIRYKLKLMKK